MAGYASVNLALIAYLKGATGTRCVTDLPANLADVLPVIQVERFGGGDDTLTLDNANVDVDVYAADRATAEALADQVRLLMRADLPGTVVADGAAFQIEHGTKKTPKHRTLGRALDAAKD